jgi:hypothetical protein
MPGGALGFLIVVNLLVFILGCFIDFFEIAFIVIPILRRWPRRSCRRPAAARRAGRRGDDLVRRHHRDEPADLVPDPAVRFCAVLPAQRRGQERLQGPHHRRDHSGRDHGADLQGLDRLHRAAGDHGRRGHRLPHAGHGGIEKGVKIDADRVLEEMRMPERAPLEAPPSGAAPGAATDLPAPVREPAEDPNQAVLDALKREREAAASAVKK